MSLELTTKGQQIEYNFEQVGQTKLKPTYVVYLEKENDGYVIDCPELNATTQGNTEDEAIKNIVEAIELVLETDGKKNDFNVDLRKKQSA